MSSQNHTARSPCTSLTALHRWRLVKAAQPRFEGHLQPNVPLWGMQSDNDPTVMAQKIDAASSHGVDHFLFDW